VAKGTKGLLDVLQYSSKALDIISKGPKELFNSEIIERTPTRNMENAQGLETRIA
jgi:hypothetical protein